MWRSSLCLCNSTHAKSHIGPIFSTMVAGRVEKKGQLVGANRAGKPKYTYKDILEYIVRSPPCVPPLCYSLGAQGDGPEFVPPPGSDAARYKPAKFVNDGCSSVPDEVFCGHICFCGPCRAHDFLYVRVVVGVVGWEGGSHDAEPELAFHVRWQVQGHRGGGGRRPA